MMSKEEARKKVDELTALGNLTKDEKEWLTRRQVILDRGLDLFMWELDLLDELHTRRTQ